MTSVALSVLEIFNNEIGQVMQSTFLVLQLSAKVFRGGSGQSPVQATEVPSYTVYVRKNDAQTITSWIKRLLLINILCQYTRPEWHPLIVAHGLVSWTKEKPTVTVLLLKVCGISLHSYFVESMNAFVSHLGSQMHLLHFSGAWRK